MATKIKKFQQLNENLLSKCDFNKSIYDPESKSIIGAYMITYKDDSIIELLNISEKKDNSSFFMDNTTSYFINVTKVRFPKNRIEIIANSEEIPELIFVKIPYHLYKTHANGLNISRLHMKKRLSIRKDQSNEKSLEIWNDPDVEKYFKLIDTDETSLGKFNYYKNYFK